MQIPVKTDGVTYLAASSPEPVLDYATQTQRADEHGQPLFSVQIVALDDGGAQVLAVKTAGEPKGIAQGVPVKLANLVATTWTMGDRSGVSFRAQRIEAAAPSRSSS
jgi:hypothetical protein